MELPYLKSMRNRLCYLKRKYRRNHIAFCLDEALNIGLILLRKQGNWVMQGHMVIDEN